MAHRLEEAGADGIVIFNRFYQPDFDLEAMEVKPALTLSNSSELLLRLHWAAMLWGHLKADMAITGGVHTAEDVVKSMMAGAKVTMLASALLQNGIGYLRPLRNQLEAWLEKHEYESVRTDAGQHEPAQRAQPEGLPALQLHARALQLRHEVELDSFKREGAAAAAPFRAELTCWSELVPHRPTVHPLCYDVPFAVQPTGVLYDPSRSCHSGAALRPGRLAFADEGMWLYNKAPKDQIKKDYNFTITDPWLEHLRLGSVRFNNGGSGSFVSEDGLAFTNHHVGRVCLQQLSTEKKDYIKDGFYAKTQAEEGKCPDLELNQLVEIQDVTAEVQGAAQPGMSDADAAQAQRQKMSAIEKECSEKSGLRCDIVTLYAGGMYNLYKYKKYTDVRVVFAPEAQMAFFGGDRDNFEYPRYDLDITYFRVYENGQPVKLKNYLQWSPKGTKTGELVFVSGHPGGTERLLTMAELNFLKDFQTSYVIDRLTRMDKTLHRLCRAVGGERPRQRR